MRGREIAPANKFIFDHIATFGVNSNKEITQETGISHATVSYLRTGKHVVNPETLLKMLQRFPPRSLSALVQMGEEWLPQYKKQQEEYGKRSSLRNRQEADPLNKEFFDFIEHYGLTDAEVSRILKISRPYISQLRSGKYPLSTRGMQVARSKIIDALVNKNP